MPQISIILRCFSCETFQVQLQKKSNKWNCKVCGEKQSIKKVYGKGSGAECRVQVQKLNITRSQLDVTRESEEQWYASFPSENDDCDLRGAPKRNAECEQCESKWARFCMGCQEIPFGNDSDVSSTVSSSGLLDGMDSDGRYSGSDRKSRIHFGRAIPVEEYPANNAKRFTAELDHSARNLTYNDTTGTGRCAVPFQSGSHRTPAAFRPSTHSKQYITECIDNISPPTFSDSTRSSLTNIQTPSRDITDIERYSWNSVIADCLSMSNDMVFYPEVQENYTVDEGDEEAKNRFLLGHESRVDVLYNDSDNVTNEKVFQQPDVENSRDDRSDRAKPAKLECESLIFRSAVNQIGCGSPPISAVSDKCQRSVVGEFKTDGEQVHNVKRFKVSEVFSLVDDDIDFTL